MEVLIHFHDIGMEVLILVSVFVRAILIEIWWFPTVRVKFLELKALEIGWTLVPVFILVGLAFPSLEALYKSERPFLKKFDRLDKIKVIGHQWYWEYEYTYERNHLIWDSFMVNEENLRVGDFRLLEVDKPLFCAWKNLIKLLVTSRDVLHRFAIPTLGIKIDAVPGRINLYWFCREYIGVFYGQCSEICGANHRFMPICLEVYK